MHPGSIGVFDSGYGGLTVLKEMVQRLPDYDFLYLGDNARAPYGTRSFETVYQYTKEAVDWFFKQGCPLVILACNTASAKALRTIQQQDLQQYEPFRRVLGVIRPTAEVIGDYTKNGHIGILATPGTVQSQSYLLEIKKFSPEAHIVQQACPLWVPLIENNLHHQPGANYFIESCVQELLQQDSAIDTLLLGCTHYPIIYDAIRKAIPPSVQLIAQGGIVAESLVQYLQRHPDMDQRLSRSGKRIFYTTDNAADFQSHTALFYGEEVEVRETKL
ncbi:MAG: glutamate racemase [Bacteroidetes bacterium]|nr:glutamate racemase [Bacteroidota bacterium]